ncbi:MULTISPECIES: hypothetical protein [Bacteroides]|uniref:Uncharacterized protein n=3 Tax=Bacteroides acidifaciens TaxID=85831 RepID=A0A7K3MHD6_9BACE|nr:hypothetical protein [Bacteroides acidifaciens]MBF0728638.1 hypothetical protein [Bacteroides acidifaciens]MBF0834026.1 hypothetical protein [Bacteroides acidifaciens]NDO53619.1 hypothetical protein [Bacteroides acidifaciens]TFU51881.1 hypothetical protein E4T97_03420 [Bacteroides acidifaciens]
MDNNSKIMIFGGVEYNEPLADISHLSQRDMDNLKHKALCAFGTYGYEKFESDEEFEQALACVVPHYWGMEEEMTEAEKIEIAAYHRGLYYHKKRFRIWKKEVLDPMVKSMADYALESPQYDARFLLGLEMRKMECMDAYFSHSVTSDSNGDYPGSRWLRLCIKLLKLLTDPYRITEDEVLYMNIRNVRYKGSDKDLAHFKSETDKDLKLNAGRDIYWHKAYHLYCHIREYALHTWWD